WPATPCGPGRRRSAFVHAMDGWACGKRADIFAIRWKTLGRIASTTAPRPSSRQGQRLPCPELPHPQTYPCVGFSHARGSDGRDRGTAWPPGYAHDRKALRSSGAELRCRYHSGAFSKARNCRSNYDRSDATQKLISEATSPTRFLLRCRHKTF